MTRVELCDLIEAIQEPLEDLGLDELAEKLAELEERLLKEGLGRCSHT